MKYNLSIRRLVQLLRTILGILSSPGALKGLVFFSWSYICSLVILPTPLYAFGYFMTSPRSCSSGLAGKKHLARALLFLLFMLAVISFPPIMCLSFRIFTLPPSVGGANIILCAAHMSRSLAFSSQSLQCCCLVCLSAFWYLPLAALCSLCTWCMGSLLSLYTFLPSLLACTHSCESSFVHHRFNFDVNSMVGTSTLMVSCKALVSSLHRVFSCP